MTPLDVQGLAERREQREVEPEAEEAVGPAPEAEEPTFATGAEEEQALPLVDQLVTVVEAYQVHSRRTALDEAAALLQGVREQAWQQGYAKAEDEYLLDLLRADGDLPDPLARDDAERGTGDTRARRRQRWLLGHSDLPPTTRVVLHAIALRMEADGGPAYPSVETLATDASVAVSTVYRILRDAEASGVLSRERGRRASAYLTVTLADDEEALRGLYTLWYRTPDDPKIEAWREEVDGGRTVDRYTWVRALRDTALPTATKGVGYAVDLLARRRAGFPARATSTGEIASLAGYHADTIRTHLRVLETGGWLEIRRPPGLGLYVRLDVPGEVRERLALRGEIRERL